MKIAVVGLGSVGGAFADLFASRSAAELLLHDTDEKKLKAALKKYRSSAPFKYSESDDCKYCILSVPDSETKKEFAKVRKKSACEIVIPSGIASYDDYAGKGRVTVVHPVQTFIVKDHPASQFDGIYAVYRSSRDADFMKTFKKLAKCRSVKVGKGLNTPLYHAAMVAGSGFHAILQAMAEKMLVDSGMKKSDVRILAPLLMQEASNIIEKGPLAAVTGPVRRGDRMTVRRHINAIDDPEMKRAYKALTEAGFKMLNEGLKGRKK